MTSSAEAEDAWCPPTFSPSRFGRTWLAWWIIHVDSQRTFWRSAWRQASVSGVIALLEYRADAVADRARARRDDRQGSLSRVSGDGEMSVGSGPPPSRR